MNDDTLLLRQVNLNWIQQGRVTSQMFRPTPKDAKRLSVYNGDLIDAVKAWRHFTNVLRFASIGVLAVTVDECKKLDLTARPDPELFPAHAIVDFSGLAENQIKTKAKRLTRSAESRGWLYYAGQLEQS